jgi:hypothetical protein
VLGRLSREVGDPGRQPGKDKDTQSRALYRHLATEQTQTEKGGTERHAENREMVEDEMPVSVGHVGLPEEDMLKIGRGF